MFTTCLDGENETARGKGMTGIDSDIQRPWGPAQWFLQGKSMASDKFPMAVSGDVIVSIYFRAWGRVYFGRYCYYCTRTTLGNTAAIMTSFYLPLLKPVSLENNNPARFGTCIINICLLVSQTQQTEFRVES